MTRASRAITIGILFGVCGIAGQLFVLRLAESHAALFRALLTIAIAASIGALAGFTGKSEAVKAATLTGFIAGIMTSSIGLGLMVRTPQLLGANPLASVEAFLSFASSVLAGTIVSSWIVAGIAALIALPISQTIQMEGRQQ